MSTLVIKLKTEEKTSLLKKAIEALLEIAEAITYEEYRDTQELHKSAIVNHQSLIKTDLRATIND